jgi:hypothetical protein
MVKKVQTALGIAVSAVSLCFCGTGADSLPLPDITLWGRYTLGQVVSSATEPGYDYDFKGAWLENIDGGMRLFRQVTPHWLGRLNAGVTVNTSTVPQKNFLSVELTAKKFTAALLDASLQYTHNDVFMANDGLQIEFGYFPFKYNPQSSNLGEYLFRSNCYPALIVSGFENSNMDKAKLAGLHLGYSCDALGRLKQDVLLNSELDIYPLHDINLTYIATYTPHPVFTIGAGVEFARLIVMDPLKTTPGLDTNFHPTVDQWVGYVTPGTNDTTLYTFKGTKLMGRGTFDIKGAIELLTGKLRLFGPEDMKLYGEAAILGVKDYPGWYEKMSQRTPGMAGFNVPTFKLLDILSVELEYFKNPYWNSQEFIWKNQSPMPYTGIAAGSTFASWNDSLAKTDDDVKWSIYASKKINKFLRIGAQAASDHTPRNLYTPGPPSFVKYTDMVPRTTDWYYMMRVWYYF